MNKYLENNGKQVAPDLKYTRIVLNNIFIDDDPFLLINYHVHVSSNDMLRSHLSDVNENNLKKKISLKCKRFIKNRNVNYYYDYFHHFYNCCIFN